MKKVICIILVMIACMLVSCAPQEMKPEPISVQDVAQITGSTAIYSSYLYVIEDRTAIAELTELYNNLTYRRLTGGEEAPEDFLSGELCVLLYYGTDGEVITDCYLSPEGYARFRDDFETTYVLTSEFDPERVKQLLKDNNLIR